MSAVGDEIAVVDRAALGATLASSLLRRFCFASFCFASFCFGRFCFGRFSYGLFKLFCLRNLRNLWCGFWRNLDSWFWLRWRHGFRGGFELRLRLLWWRLWFMDWRLSRNGAEDV